MIEIFILEVGIDLITVELFQLKALDLVEITSQFLYFSYFENTEVEFTELK